MTQDARRYGPRRREALGPASGQKPGSPRLGLWTQSSLGPALPSGGMVWGGGREGGFGGLAASRREQQLDELLELLPMLVDVDLSLPEGVDQHRVVDLV